MIPVTQTKVSIKNSKGESVQYGNCYAACIASILEVPISEVPNVEVFFHIDSGYWHEVMLTFLSSKGWDLSRNDIFGVFHNNNSDSILDGYRASNSMFVDKYYLVSGESPRGIQHMCIYQNGILVHDPYPTREGLIRLDEFYSLEKIG